jgi:hypothetical protein
MISENYPLAEQLKFCQHALEWWQSTVWIVVLVLLALLTFFIFQWRKECVRAKQYQETLTWFYNWSCENESNQLFTYRATSPGTLFTEQIRNSYTGRATGDILSREDHINIVACEDFINHASTDQHDVFAIAYLRECKKMDLKDSVMLRELALCSNEPFRNAVLDMVRPEYEDESPQEVDTERSAADTGGPNVA